VILTHLQPYKNQRCDDCGDSNQFRNLVPFFAVGQIGLHRMIYGAANGQKETIPAGNK
jgi:hypothetical protein